jgi:hypothetical protein
MGPGTRKIVQAPERTQSCNSTDRPHSPLGAGCHKEAVAPLHLLQPIRSLSSLAIRHLLAPTMFGSRLRENVGQIRGWSKAMA